MFITFEKIPGRSKLKRFLTNRLVKEKKISDSPHGSHSVSDSVIYILCGAQKSLESRFVTASRLYKARVAKKIMILSVTGTTMYSRMLGKTITYDEWSIMKLEEMGVKKEDIEPVPIERGYFGTFSEAKGISDFVFNRGYKNLILVSSVYHTKRVWESFSRFFNSGNRKLYVYISEDYTDLRGLFKEYVKYFVYKYFLLKRA